MILVEEKRLYKASEVARMLGVNRYTIYMWQKQGIISMKKINGRFYAGREEVERLLEGS